MIRPHRWVPILTAAVLLSSAADAKRVRDETLDMARTEIPEAALLDVGIEIFDPGLPAGDEYAREDEGVHPEIRRAEARHFAVRLMETMQSTGYWGAVRIVPAGSDTVDLRVEGAILQSNGLEMEVEIRAVDATGDEWVDREYRAEAKPAAYRDGSTRDPFEALFAAIANDLNEEREDLDAEEAAQIRQVAQLHFARDLAPQTFGDYLERDRRGRWEVERLPAEGDPMLERVTRIRERDYLFIDTLTQHYANFSHAVSEPYDQWRRYSYEEALAYKELRRQATWRQVLGGLLILGAVLSDADNSAEAAARDVAIYGGMATIGSGLEKVQEAKMHKEALRELALSLDAEVRPVLVEVEGRTVQLRGSVEDQVKQWRELLQEIFVEETGLTRDPDTGDLVELPVVAGDDPASDDS